MALRSRWPLSLLVATACSSNAPPCAAFDTTIPATSPGANAVWVGDEYLIVTSGMVMGAGPQTMDSTIQIVTSTGTVGAVFATIPASEGEVPYAGRELSWSGSTLGVLVLTGNGSGLELVRFDHSGHRLGATMLAQLGAAGPYPNLVWDGSHFDVALLTNNDTQLTVYVLGEDGGSVSTDHVGEADVMTTFETLRDFMVTPSSYAALTSYNYAQPQIVQIDRSSGTISSVAIADFDPLSLAVRDDELAFVSPVGSSTAFSTAANAADPTAAVDLALPVGIDGLGMVGTSSGFVIYAAGPQGTDGTCPIELLAVDENGAATQPFTTIGSYACAGGSYGPSAVSRGNGTAAYLSYGATQRLIQQCD